MKKHRICLLYHIKRCQGPCQGLVAQSDYLWTVNQVVAFIQGRNSQLKKDLEGRMTELAAKKRFEEAALLRDEIRSIAAFQSRQKVVDDLQINRDIVVTAQEGILGCGLVFNVRDGKIVNRIHFFLENVETLGEPEILANFLKLYYVRTDDVPENVMLPAAVPDSPELEAWLSQKRGGAVRFEYPKRGKPSQLMAMCRENAHLLLNELMLQKEKSEHWTAPSVQALQKDLALAKPPRRIEAFDISNLLGKDTVASMVVFENGQPKKSEYRKFKIRSVDGSRRLQDDGRGGERRFAGLPREDGRPRRSHARGRRQGTAFRGGGRAQRSDAEGQPVIGLAKRLEEIYRPGLSDPQTCRNQSAGLRLLQRVRDEAHGSRLQYHRTLRNKRPSRRSTPFRGSGKNGGRF